MLLPPSSSGTSASCIGSFALREQHVKTLVEGLPEVVRQPEIGLRHQEVGIALQPIAIGAVEAEHQRRAGHVGRHLAAIRERRHDGGGAFQRRHPAVLVEVDAEPGEVDLDSDLGIARNAGERRRRLRHAVPEVGEDAPEAVIGERLGIGIRGDRQPHQGQHQGSRAFEAVAMQPASELFQRHEEFDRSAGVGGERIARLRGLEFGQRGVTRRRRVGRKRRRPRRRERRPAPASARLPGPKAISVSGLSASRSPHKSCRTGTLRKN